MTTESEEEIQRRYFGKGLQLSDTKDIGVDISFIKTEGGKDLAMQSGGENLGQDLKVALLTATGTDVFNLGFGFDGIKILTSDMTPAMTAEMFRLSIMKTIAVDSRVKRVLDVSLEQDDQDKLLRRYRVNVEIQTILGDVLRLTLGEI